MLKIRDKDIQFHEHSFFDPAGRLFWLDSKLYRKINPEWTSFYKNLFDNGLIKSLVDQKLLIESTITPFAFEDGSMVIQHRAISFLSYPYEWSPAMFKVAAVTTIDLLLELSEKGLTLKDGHLGNILFDFYRPIYIDLPSIIGIKDYLLWPGYAYQDFCETCFYPLMLMDDGQYQLAKLFLANDMRLPLKDIMKFTQCRVTRRVICFYIAALKAKLNYKYYKFAMTNSLHKAAKSDYSSSFLNRVKTVIEKMSSPIFHGNGLQKSFSPFLNQPDWNLKQKNVFAVIQEKSPQTVLDIENSSDWYAKVCALSGSNVISFSKDVQYANQLYKDAQDNQLKILSLIMDFMKPTPSWGPSNHWAVSAYDRFRCDLVLAINIIHYWVQDLYFEQIVEGLSLFSRKCLIVEFISLDDLDFMKKPWLTKVKHWYSLDKLVDVLKIKFARIDLLPSHAGSRVLIVCEK